MTTAASSTDPSSADRAVQCSSRKRLHVAISGGSSTALERSPVHQVSQIILAVDGVVRPPARSAAIPTVAATAEATITAST